SPLLFWITRAPCAGSGLISLTGVKYWFSFTRWLSSPAVVVITLNVDPGGCGDEYAEPARASTSPVLALSTTTPPERPASAFTVTCWSPGSTVVRTSCPGLSAAVARTRPGVPGGTSGRGVPSLTASSCPPGCPARRELNASSRPLTPV